MRKLSPSDVNSLIEDHRNGVAVVHLSVKFNVTKGIIYYHIRNKTIVEKIERPSCYKDYLKNSIIMLTQKLSTCDPSKEKHIRGEIKRLKSTLKINTSNFSSDPFTIQ